MVMEDCFFDCGYGVEVNQKLCDEEGAEVGSEEVESREKIGFRDLGRNLWEWVEHSPYPYISCQAAKASLSNLQFILLGHYAVNVW